MEQIIEIAITALVVIIFVAAIINYNNQEVSLRKEAEAQRKNIEGIHDRMWKTIKQKAGVTEQYREAFEKVYPQIMSGRYGNDIEAAMKWIQEANPEFDTSLYKDLMQTIEVQRAYFHNSQERMLDIVRERETLLDTIPAMFFIFNRRKIEYTMVTSTRSKKAMDTGLDDESELFNHSQKISD